MRFRLSQDDINRGKLVEPNLWYRMRVEKVYDEPAKDKESTNTKVDLRIMEGTFKDLVITRVFSEKAPGFVIPYLAAFNVEVKADESYDLSATEGRELMVFVTHREYQNQKFNDATQFKPVSD